MSILIENENSVVQEFFASMRARVLIDTTLDQMDNMISAVTEEQLDSSILNAIDYINLVKPVTNINTLSAVKTAKASPAFRTLILLASCYQILRVKWIEWGHSGDEIQLSILSEPDRMDRFKALMEEFKNQVDELAPGLKKMNNTRLSISTYASTSKTIQYGRNTSLRRGFKSAYKR